MALPAWTVLVVEDDPAHRYAVRRILESAGYAVEEAATGEEGLAAAREGGFDLVVLDVNLPGLSGFEVCRRLKSDPATAGVAVLHLTASYPDAEHMARGLDGGADAYLCAPVEPVALLAVVRALLRNRDAMERLRRAEAEMRNAREEAQRATALRDRFLAIVAHELRTPLNALSTWAQVLRGEVTAGQLAQGVAAIQRSVATQERLVSDLLDVARVVTGKLGLQVAPFDPAAAAESALTTLRPDATQRGIGLLSEVEPGGLVEGDTERVQQVVRNLLSNALRFTPPGGVVRLELRWHGDSVVVSVQDTGPGVPADLLPRIFDFFAQGEPDGGRSGGLGLGLAISRQIADLHGGAMAARNLPQGGARFELRLPGRPPRPARATVDAAREGGRVRLDGARVAVVDDDAESRDAISHLLERAGASVLRLPGGPQAMATLARERADVLVSDLKMPQIDGFELLPRLRALPGNERLPAIALSALVQAPDQARALRAGYREHLAKPVDGWRLLAAIHSALSGA